MASDSERETLNILKHYLIAQASLEKHGNGPASMTMRSLDIRTDESIRDNPFPSCDFYVLEKQPDGSVTRSPRWYTQEAKRARFWWRKVPTFAASWGLLMLLLSGFSWVLLAMVLFSAAMLLFSAQTVRAAIGCRF